MQCQRQVGVINKVGVELGIKGHLELREEDGAALSRLRKLCAVSQCFSTLISWHTPKS